VAVKVPETPPALSKAVEAVGAKVSPTVAVPTVPVPRELRNVDVPVPERMLFVRELVRVTGVPAEGMVKPSLVTVKMIVSVFVFAVTSS